MHDNKTRFAADYHTSPDKLATLKPFQTRAKLRIALAAYLETAGFSGDAHEAAVLAQQLAFMPSISRGWGPTASDLAQTAKNLVDCYSAHVAAFNEEGFPAPAEAALEALKDFAFSL
jgi:hypothetical protein